MNNNSISKFIDESNIQFNNRILYIKKLEENNINLKEAIRLSKIWYCIKYKNCKYSLEIHNNIMYYDNK